MRIRCGVETVRVNTEVTFQNAHKCFNGGKA
jgi:hypothetical protein